MNCPKCNTPLVEGATFCHACGTKHDGTVVLPENYRPLSAWAYFGLSILFSIPIVGLVFLIVFSFSRANINRRSFARSYWCGCIIAIGLVLVILALVVALRVNTSELMYLQTLL